MKAKLVTLALAVALAKPSASNAQEGLAKIKTIVVIYAENRSFDTFIRQSVFDRARYRE
jgi:phospholipase C